MLRSLVKFQANMLYRNASAPHPGLAQMSAFPQNYAESAGPSEHLTRCPRSRPALVSSVDTGNWVPNGPSGVFLAEDMDLDSASTQQSATPLTQVYQPPTKLAPQVSGLQSSTIAPTYASNMPQALKTSGAGGSQRSTVPRQISATFTSSSVLASTSNIENSESSSSTSSTVAQAAGAPSIPTQTPRTSFAGKDTQSSPTTQAGGGSQAGNGSQAETTVEALKSRLTAIMNNGMVQKQPSAITTPHPRRSPPPQVHAQPAAAAPRIPPQFQSFLSGARSGAPLLQPPTTLSQPFIFGAAAPMGSPQAPATQSFQFGAATSTSPQAVPVSQSSSQPLLSTASVLNQPSQPVTATPSANGQSSSPAPARTLDSARLDPKLAASLQNLLNSC